HALRLAVCAALLSMPVAASAQAPSAQPQQQPPPNAAPFPQSVPEHKPGMLEGFDDAWKGMGGIGNTTADVAKGTADAAGAVTKGAVDAAKGTADAFG